MEEHKRAHDSVHKTKARFGGSAVMTRLLVPTLPLAMAGLWLVSPQEAQQQSPQNLQQQVDRFLADRRLKELSECNANLGAVEQKKNDLGTENFILKRKLEALSSVPAQWIVWISAGSGVGLLAAFMIFKAAKRAWPLIERASRFSPAKKQLFVLIVGATWISVAILLAIFLNSDLSGHPINLLAMIGVYSLPAVLFGGVCFWWIGKNQPSQGTQ